MSTQTKPYRCPTCRKIGEIGADFECQGGGLYWCKSGCNNDVRIVPAKPKKLLKQRISRQRRKRLDKDAEYNAMRDIYLEQNPVCVRCGHPANQVHHIVSGTAGRSKSLLNPDAWLGVCGICHDKVGELKPETQIKLKQFSVKKTIERLRK